MKLKLKIISSFILTAFIALMYAENPIVLRAPGKVLIEKDSSLQNKTVSIKYYIFHYDNGRKIYDTTPSTYTLLQPDAIIISDSSWSDQAEGTLNNAFITLTSVNISGKIIPIYCINDIYAGNIPHTFTLLHLFSTGQIGCVEGNL